jgi:hypothetical protein
MRRKGRFDIVHGPGFGTVQDPVKPRRPAHSERLECQLPEPIAVRRGSPIA